jgi:hypothetical protein
VASRAAGRACPPLPLGRPRREPPPHGDPGSDHDGARAGERRAALRHASDGFPAGARGRLEAASNTPASREPRRSGPKRPAGA